MNYKELCEQTRNVAKEAGRFIRNEREWFNQNAVEYKGANDLVSYVDKRAEDLIISSLKKTLPEAGFIAEEGTEGINEKKLQWIVDPLDGTTNFVHGLPCYCVSIALMEEKEIVVGVIYEINLDECFYSWKGGASYLNENEIKVSEIDTLSKSLIATGFPYIRFDRQHPYMDVFEYLMHNTHGLRRIGSAAADIAYVACGRFEAFFEYGLKPWDVAAGVIIVKNAGGKISDFKGGNDYLFGEEYIAANANVYDEFLKIVKSKFEQV